MESALSAFCHMLAEALHTSRKGHVFPLECYETKKVSTTPPPVDPKSTPMARQHHLAWHCVSHHLSHGCSEVPAVLLRSNSPGSRLPQLTAEPLLCQPKTLTELAKRLGCVYSLQLPYQLCGAATDCLSHGNYQGLFQGDVLVVRQQTVLSVRWETAQTFDSRSLQQPSIAVQISLTFRAVSIALW